MLYLALVAVSCAGAWVTYAVRESRIHWAWLYLPALCSATLWLLLSRSAQRLGLAAVLFDVAVAASYLFTFAALGEPWRYWHVAGAALAVIGCALMAHS